MHASLASKSGYGWDAFENGYGNEKPTSGTHLPMDAGPAQRLLLAGPVELLRLFGPSAAPPSRTHLSGAWRHLAKFFTEITLACKTHALGCGQVSPPKQLEWLRTQAPTIEAFYRQGPHKGA